LTKKKKKKKKKSLNKHTTNPFFLDGIVLAAEKKVVSPLLEPSASSDKMYKVDSHIAVAVAGITADANILVDHARVVAQRYRFQYQEPQPVETLVQYMCDYKQGYTQFGGLRPFGVSFLFAGADVHHGLQLYASDPSGNYGGWKARAIGANSQSATSVLKQEWNEQLDLDGALKLALKVLSKTMDSTSLAPEKLDFATLTYDRLADKVHFAALSVPQLKELIAKTDLTSNSDDEN
jgi:20S proteasome subunit alpha 3